ncbi:hypothetical protein [Cupriavidus sp. YAF13]|uniref:hypothetical protein n=1 Tax=Cupriavidus sp. YAF13 TaxID=3233075 RepID=UPI003F8E6C91
MNIYRHQFICVCPANGKSIVFDLEIKSTKMIHVEHITTAAAVHGAAYHEELADFLQESLGGHQELKAHHHGVDIVTYRGSVEPSSRSAAKPAVAHISAAHLRILQSGVAVVTHVSPTPRDGDVALTVV